ncbi:MULTISPECIES: hypothetical protein [Bacillus]|uniref:hypothetical protein n=1 Tax=Bacillus TaxID=1386 RepID=UPI000330BD56|nr:MULTISPECIES: hypothetical protein [Bacillus cereus group]EOP53408.1 hypothetical protein IIW_01944 [Bacillus cereus VD136]EOP68401.1 hypothetical protein KOW_03610 [Bacillus cereus VDM006]EOQ05041.1 hypothetical protein KOY_02827 [Bacillus cereus VDM021]OOG94177.1 hypothetical protein BTH41_01876 [Bacillus mycoides]MDF2086314.1 hypothetical protein [Bacillus pseudomycoides]
MSKLLLEKIELVKDILGDDSFSLVIGEIVEAENQIDEKLEDNILIVFQQKSPSSSACRT